MLGLVDSIRRYLEVYASKGCMICHVQARPGKHGAERRDVSNSTATQALPKIVSSGLNLLANEPS